jgi:uncharacterized protein YkwD
MDYNREIFSFVGWLNLKRGKDSYLSLKISEDCQAHNHHMACEGKLSHSEFWNSGECVARISARDFSGESLFFAWKESPQHDYIMMSDYGSFGVAFYWKDDYVYATFRTA